MIDFTKIDDMVSADGAVRYAGILDSKGNLIAGKMRKEKSADDTYPREEEVFRVDLCIMKQMPDLEDDAYEKIISVYAKRENIQQLIYYLDNLIVYITCDSHVDDKKILEISGKVQKVIDELVV